MARAALRHGVLQHTGDTDPAERSRTDLMSWVITSLRHHHSRRSLGEYHTPPDISDLMANVLAEGSTGKRPRQRGEWALEPTAGTGGLFRSAAQDLRRDGEDPANGAGSCSNSTPWPPPEPPSNTLVWELGPRAFVGCGDVLAQPDLAEETSLRRAAWPVTATTSRS